MKVLHPDKHCDSYIIEGNERDGCAKFVFVIKTWIFFHPRGGIISIEKDTKDIFEIEEFSDTEQTTFRNKFVEMIRNGWGDGAIWLLHRQKGTKDLWCDIEIEYTDSREEAHLCVGALKNPRTKDGKYFRIGCADRQEYRVEPDFSTSAEWNRYANPFDMKMSQSGVVGGKAANGGKLPDGTNITLYQQPLQHEFGHYLGCSHFCSWAGGDAEQYCSGQSAAAQDDIMAIGDKYRPYVGVPFMLRLMKHDYVSTQIFPWIAHGHTDTGGGDRKTRPWMQDTNPVFDWARE